MLSVAIQTDVSITAIEIDQEFGVVLRNVQNALGGLFAQPTPNRSDARFDTTKASLLNMRLASMMTAMTGRMDRVEIAADADKSLGLDLLVVIKPAENSIYAVRADWCGRPNRYNEWNLVDFMYLGDFSEGWKDA